MSENIKLNAWEAAEEIVNLRRENAALRKAKEMVELERCEMMRTMSLAQNYSEQLRADKERLDWIIGKAPYLFFKALRSDLAKGRDQIS